MVLFIIMLIPIVKNSGEGYKLEGFCLKKNFLILFCNEVESITNIKKFHTMFFLFRFSQQIARLGQKLSLILFLEKVLSKIILSFCLFTNYIDMLISHIDCVILKT